MLLQRSMRSASARASVGSPSPPCEMSSFWQKTQYRLQWAEEDGAAAGITPRWDPLLRNAGTRWPRQHGGRSGTGRARAASRSTASVGTQVTRSGAAPKRFQQGGKTAVGQGVEINGPRRAAHRQPDRGIRTVGRLKQSRRRFSIHRMISGQRIPPEPGSRNRSRMLRDRAIV